MSPPFSQGSRFLTASLEIAEAAVENWRQAVPRPMILGICGAQGSGKSTLARRLRERFEERGARVAVLSLDDLYLGRSARGSLAQEAHPLFATRGVPGTHDVELGVRLLDDLKAGRSVKLPRFDKGSDERLPESEWPQISAADMIILEGWCVGARPQDEADLIEPVNDLERDRDRDGRWRRAVNEALKGPYARLFGRIDRLLLLAAPNFLIVRDWRTQQEHGLRRRLRAEGKVGARVMSDDEVARFIQFYERLTRHILREMPGRADLTIRLDMARHPVREN